MSELRQIEVIDRDGWRKKYPLQKNIIHIGSDARNDITLEPQRGSGVALRHVQMIPGGNGTFKLVNVGDSDIYVGEQRDRRVPPRAFAEVRAGEFIAIGEFTVMFSGFGGGLAGPARAGAMQTSSSIGLQLSLTSNEIGPTFPVDGAVLVHNRGDRSGVQFRLEVEGLEPELFEIGPGPILASDAEARVFLRLTHPRGPWPQAGERRLMIRATAPDAYLAESAVVTQVVTLMPFHEYRLNITPKK